VILGFSIEINIRIHFHFSTFFWVSESAPSTVASGPPSATFPTVAETYSYATGLQLKIFLSNFLLNYTENAYHQRGFSNATYTTASLPRQMLTPKQSTMHFAMAGFGSYKLCEVNFFDVLDKMNAERGNVWNQFLVSSGLVCLYAVLSLRKGP